MAGITVQTFAKGGEPYMYPETYAQGNPTIQIKNSTGSKITTLDYWATCVEGGEIRNVAEVRTVTLNLAKGANTAIGLSMLVVGADDSHGIISYLRGAGLRQTSSGTVTLHLSANGYMAEVDMDYYVKDRTCGPAVETFAVERCSPSGEPAIAGTHILVTAQLSMSDAAWQSAFRLTLECENQTEDLTAMIGGLLAGEMTFLSSLAGLTAGSDHALRLVFVENGGGESAFANTSIDQAFVNFDESDEATGGVAIGKYSNATAGHPLFECDYPALLNKGADVPGLTSFSEEAVKTGGTWIDGREIWAQTFTEEVTTTGSAVSVGTIADFGEAVAFFGHQKRTSSETNFALNFYNSSSSYSRCYITSGGAVTVQTSSAGTYAVTVWYVKDT